jgi:Tfp pilus assembly protein PilX
VRKNAVKRLIRDEKGYIMILALLVLVLVGLISGPVLSYMVSGLRAGHVFETGAAELYAADGGVTYGLWKIEDAGLCPGNLPQSYNINVDGKSVAVNIENANNVTYKVTSSATTGNNSHTTVVSYVDVTFMSMLDNAITSLGNVEIGSNTVVNGDVQYGGEITNHGTVNGTSMQDVYTNWPPAGELSDIYLEQVQGAPDPGSPVEINGQTTNLTRSYRNGDLDIENTPNNPGTLILQGTVYVDGDLDFKQPGGSKGAYTVNLNGQTIFVTGSIVFPSNGVSVSGSGCIIAIGNINFQPGMQGTEGDFVFVMSIDGTVEFKPNGTFYGSLAGDVKVDLQPNCEFTWHSLGGTSLNFPIDSYQTVKTATISSWEVSRL